MSWMGWIAIGLVVWLAILVTIMAFPMIAARTDRRNETIKRREAAARRQASIADWRRRNP